MLSSRKAPLSAAAQRAIERATNLAAACLSPRVEPVHLLAAVLLETESRAAELVARHGGDPADIARSLVNPSQSSETGDQAQLPPLAPETSNLLNYATSRDLVPRGLHAGTDHILAAVLRRVPSLRETLQAAGVDVDEILNRVRNGEEDAPDLGPAIPVDDYESHKEPAVYESGRDHQSGPPDGERLSLAPLLTQCFQRVTRLIELCGRNSDLARHMPPLAAILTNVAPHVPASERPAASGDTTAHEPPVLVAAELAGLLRAAANVARQTGQEELARSLAQSADVAGQISTELARAYDRRLRLHDARLYVLVGRDCPLGPVETAVRAIKGGADIVQLRLKGVDDRCLYELAAEMAPAVSRHGALFIVNDRADVAVAVNADGVHVGQEELPVPAARCVVGTERLVGLSTHSPEQAREAVLSGADYIGVGPVFPSRTKHFDALAGLELVRQVCPGSSLPAFAIGGINAENIRTVLDAGARRVAVSHAICTAADPEAEARKLRALIDAYW